MKRDAWRAWADRWAAEPYAVDMCGLDGRLRWKLAEHALFYGTFAWATAHVATEAFASPTGGGLLTGAGALLVGWYTYGSVTRRRRPAESLRIRGGHVAVTCALWVFLVMIHPSYTIVGLGVLAQVYGFLPWRLALPGGIVVVGIMSSPAAFDGDGLQGGEVVNTILVFGLMVLGSISMRAMVVESARRQRLIEELQATREELAIAERQAGMADERQRLAAELHDTLTQGFTSIVMLLEAGKASLRSNAAKTGRDIESAVGIARENLGEVRSLVWALHPEALEQQTLAEALESLTSRLEEQAQVATRIVVTGDVNRLPAEVESTLLRAGQEALTNVRRHARAARITVTLSYMESVVALDVQDDGAGFDVREPSGRLGGSGGLGLVAMRERVEALGGALAVESTPGEGTCVAVRLPVAPPGHKTVPSGLATVAP